MLDPALSPVIGIADNKKIHEENKRRDDAILAVSDWLHLTVASAAVPLESKRTPTHF